MDTIEEHALWHSWRAEGDLTAREQLVHRHLELAKILAAKLFRRRTSSNFAFAEYMQYATVGLLESVDRYEPALGIGFRTFASRRITGAMLDGLYQMSEQQQQIQWRQRLRAERAASLAHMQPAVGRATVFEELAEIAIGLALGFLLEDTPMLQLEEPTQLDQQYARLELRQLQQRVCALVANLPERERLVIKYHYFHQVPFEQIATMFSVSRGRISQIHHRALRQLREAAGRVQRCDVSW